MNFVIILDSRYLNKLHARLSGVSRGYKRAMQPSIKRGLEHGRTLIKQEITKELTIRQKEVTRTIRVSASPDSGSITVSREPRPLISFGRPSQTRKGVSVTVRRGRGREQIPHAFIATMKSGHAGIFIRKPGSVHQKVTKNGKVTWSQLPIKQIYGPTVVGVLAGKPGLVDRISKSMASFVVKRLESQVDRLLAGK